MGDRIFSKSLLVKSNQDKLDIAEEKVNIARNVHNQALASRQKFIDTKLSDSEIAAAELTVTIAQSITSNAEASHTEALTAISGLIDNGADTNTQEYREAEDQLEKTVRELSNARRVLNEKKEYLDSINGSTESEEFVLGQTITAANVVLEQAIADRNQLLTQLGGSENDTNPSLMGDLRKELMDNIEDFRDAPQFTSIQGPNGSTIDPSKIKPLGFDCYDSVQTELNVNQLPFSFPNITEGLPITHDINLPKSGDVTHLELTDSIQMSKAVSELIEQDTIRMNNLTSYFESKSDLLGILNPPFGIRTDNIEKSIKFYERSRELQAAKSNYELSQRQRLLQCIKGDVVIAKTISDYKVGDYDTCRNHPNEMPDALKY